MEQRNENGRHEWRLSENARNLNPRNAYGVLGRHNRISYRCHTSATRGGSGWIGQADEEPQLNERLEDDLVSPEGIDLPGEPGGRSHQADAVRGEANRAKRRLVCSACTQNNEVRHVVVKSSWGPDGGNPPSTRQGRSHDRTTREGASGRSLMMQYRTERKRSAVRGVQTWGELANGSEADIRRAGGRIGDGVGTKFCVLTRGDLSASAWSAVVIEKPTTR
jgi:hypothetical protein